LANRELLLLYYRVGRYISQNSRNAQWGTNTIEVISRQLENELPGLRGFSTTNLKKMRTFYEAWENLFSNRPLTTDEIAEYHFSGDTNALAASATTSQHVDNTADNAIITNRPLATDDLTPCELDSFLKIGFTHHYEMILKIIKQNRVSRFMKKACFMFHFFTNKIRSLNHYKICK
jgi:hypothetical protein